MTNAPRPGTERITVVGAGLAGSECALQLAELGHNVDLIEMRGLESTPAHKSSDCAELVCSNSFGSLAGHSAPGLLKWEAEQMGSQILAAALEARVPAGQALSMDRELFAKLMTQRVDAHPRINRVPKVVRNLAELPRPTVIATGPLTQSDLASDLQQHFGGEFLYFFDAIAPIIATESINTKIAWKSDRWDKGTKDYFNCPLNKREYHFFLDAIREAKKIEPKDFEKDTPYFESCMPIEAMLERGPLTLRFGPMSPKGLRDPRTGNTPFAVVQLRQDNREATAYNMVGFQTKMAYADQKRVFRLIPGLEEAEFLKLGSIHRNLYINSPRLLNPDLSSRRDPWLFFAGQITGVEGYFESACIGLLVARFLDAKLCGRLALDAIDLDSRLELRPPRETALGSLLLAITAPDRADHFQPTNINFGLLPAAPNEVRDKNERRQAQVDRAKDSLLSWLTGTSAKAATGRQSRIDEASRALLASSQTSPAL